MNIPERNSQWAHKSGTVYMVLCVTNEMATKTSEYPVTVVYVNAKEGGPIWSRPLSGWHSSFKELVTDNDK